MTSRINIIGQNGNTGEHYVFEEMAEDLIGIVSKGVGYIDFSNAEYYEIKQKIIEYLLKD